MSTRHAFRPQVSGSLEQRTLPSLAAVLPPPVVLVHSVPLPPQVRDSDQVRAAFDAFIRSYTEAVRTVLLAPGLDGSVHPAAHLGAFHAAVEQALNTLADSLVASLGDIPADSPLVAQVFNAIRGDGPESLESQLLGLSAATIAQQSSIRTFLGDSLQATLRTRTVVAAQLPDLVPGRPLVAQGAPAEPQVSIVTADGDPTTREWDQAVQRVRSAFTTFLIEYQKAVRDVLLRAGADGTIDPPAHRAAFDARVDAALQALGDRLSRDPALDPAAPDLAARLREAIAGGGADSLKARLAALPTPTGSQATLVREFTLGSIRAIADALALIMGDVSRFLSS
jgi:hypothetical protein